MTTVMPDGERKTPPSGGVVTPAGGVRRIGIEGNDGYRLYVDGALVIDNWKKQSYGTRVADVGWAANTAHELRLEYFETTGNAHVRRTLVEAAWHYRHLPCVSEAIKRRQAGLAPQVCQIAWRAQQRLSRRMYHLLNKGKSPQKMVVALARELVGFVWAIGQEQQPLAA